MSGIIDRKWYAVGPPWGDGTWIIAGNHDPHAGQYVCEASSGDDDGRPGDRFRDRATIAHIVRLHNEDLKLREAEEDENRMVGNGVLKQRRRDMPGFIYRFICISTIKNNALRRLALMVSFPIFMSFNCLAMIPLIALVFVRNNLELLETVLKRWSEPMDESEVPR